MNQHPSTADRWASRQPPIGSDAACRTVEELLEAYALHSLDPHDESMVDRHLVECSRCAEIVAGYESVAAMMALTVPQIAPPIGTRAALLEQVRALPPASSRPRTATSIDTLRTPTLPASTTPNPTLAPASNPSWWRVYAAPLATLPLLLALGLVGAWGLNNYLQLEETRADIASRDLQIQRLWNQLDTDDQSISQVLMSPASKRYLMSPEVASAGNDAAGTLIADPMTERAVLQVNGLDAGIYSIIVQTQDGAIVPQGEFVVGTEGVATTLVDLDTQVSNLRSVHIRPTTSVTETDVAAIAAQPDVLMTTIGPDLFENMDTSPQSP